MSPPSSMAHYRITSKLGEGSMGAVFRATDTKLSREQQVFKATPQGSVKVLDFGLAKAFSNDGAAAADSANSPTLTMRKRRIP